MDDFISKPVNLLNLRDKIVKYLPKSRTFSLASLNTLDSVVGVEARKKVVRAFLSTTENFKHDLARALQRHELDALNRLGHRYHSAALTVGGIEFAQLCREMELAQSVETVASSRDKLSESLYQLEQNLADLV